MSSTTSLGRLGPCLPVRRTLAISGLAVTAFLGLLSGVEAAPSLPEIRVGASNRVPACATPGRLMRFLAERNPKLPDVPAFRTRPHTYGRHIAVECVPKRLTAPMTWL